MPDFFDVHSHIHSREFDLDRTDVISRLKKENVWTITVGTDKESSIEAVEATELYEGIFASIGQHPTDNTEENFDSSFYVSLIANPKVLAIGECGLDYYRSKDNSEQEKLRQKKIFESQIIFALENNKPLMLHCRDAYEDVLLILESYKKGAGDKLRGNVHFFAGNVSIAERFLSLGFTLSFTGVLTFTHDYDEVVSYIPLESILSETDCPFVAPVPFRSKRNEPAYISHIVRKIAEIKQVPFETVKEAMVKNSLTLFLGGVQR